MGALTSRLRPALVRTGLDQTEIPGREELFGQTMADFESTFSRAPEWLWWVPGRIEVFGKHTDYAGGRSLVAAVPRGFAIAAAPRDDQLIVARDSKWGAAAQIRFADTAQAYAGWTNYLAVVARRFAADFPGASLGCDITFASDLPRAAGVSSSSALVVGVALALIERASLMARPEWARSISSTLDLAGYLGAVENGLGFGQFGATDGVGTHGGSEDHTAILNGRPDLVSAFSYVPVQEVGTAALPAHWRFVVMASGVEASKAGAVKDRYNALSLSTRALVDLWRRSGGASAPTLGAIVRQGALSVAALEEAARRDASAPAGAPAGALALRLAHFVAEDARVPRALDAFARADAGTLGELAAASQRDAAAWLQNQIPETVELVAAAREAGAFAATSFGAGFGGSAWALVETEDAEAAGAPAFLERWRAAYLARQPHAERAAGFVARPAPAATRLDL